jgi:hypothetical protein
MKTTISTLVAVAVLGASAHTAFAGDREWATAGKILTGVAVGAVIAKSLEPVPTYTYSPAYYPPPVVQVQPPVYVQPAPVYVPPPVYVQSAPVYVRPAPVVVYSQPVYVQPAPVYVRTAPVYYAPRPVVGFHFSFGRSHHHGPPVYRVCR